MIPKLLKLIQHPVAIPVSNVRTEQSDFQPFLSHGTYKLITKLLWHMKNVISFANPMKEIAIIFIHLPQTAIVVIF